MEAGPGGKAGTFGVASSQQDAIARRERLRKLALETIDLARDPYCVRNHVGLVECKLCLTVHRDEGNYLAHTQGKRHQDNLGRRAARDAATAAALPAPVPAQGALAGRRRGIRIGRPGYRVVKQWDAERRQRSLLFEVSYPEIEEGLQQRHRFMSAYEQRLEAPSREWQYLLFAAAPYETIAFKVPSDEVERDPRATFSHWEPLTRTYTMQLTFRSKEQAAAEAQRRLGPTR